MRNFKKLALNVLGMAILVTGFVACSSDDGTTTENVVETTNETTQNSVKSTSSAPADYVEYVGNFYEEDFTEGRVIDIYSEEREGIQIKEIIVNGEARARGYVVSDLTKGEFLYFADVDRDNDEMIVFDAVENKSTTFSNLRESKDYLATDKFDFIKYSNEYATRASKKDCGFWKRLWGKCTTVEKRPVRGIGGEIQGCHTWTITRHYAFFTEVSEPDIHISSLQPCY